MFLFRISVSPVTAMDLSTALTSPEAGTGPPKTKAERAAAAAAHAAAKRQEDEITAAAIAAAAKYKEDTAAAEAKKQQEEASTGPPEPPADNKPFVVVEISEAGIGKSKNVSI